MPANTSPDNITYPVSTDPISPLETVFANQAQSTQDAFTALRTSLSYGALSFADATARDAAIPSPATGMQAVTLDNGYTWRYDGSAWKIWNIPATTFTPTWTGFGPTSANTGTVSVTSGLMDLRYSATLGSTPTVTQSTFTIPLSLQMTGPAGGVLPGNVMFTDLSAGSAGLFQGSNQMSTATSIRLMYNRLPGTGDTASPIQVVAIFNGTVPFTWASGDSVSGGVSGIPVTL